MAEIKSVRIHHEMILTWLILNPARTQGECAAEFGVTEAWLSTVINSDCFQARWAERRAAMAGGVDGVLIGAAREVALKSLRRLSEKVDCVEDPELLLNTTDKLLGRLGFGPKTAGAAGPNIGTQNVFVVDQDLLAQARARIAAQGQAATPVLTAPTVELLDADPGGCTPTGVEATGCCTALPVEEQRGQL